MSGNSSNSLNKKIQQRILVFQKFRAIPRRLKERCLPWKSAFFSSRKLFALEKQQSEMQTKTL